MVGRVVGPSEDFQALPHSPQVSWLVLGLGFPVLEFGFSYHLLAGSIGRLHGRVTNLNVFGRGLPLLKEEVLAVGFSLFLDCQFAGQAPQWAALLA